MGETRIEWCDKVWNPVTGCTPVSEGCANCYARRMATRLAGRCGYSEVDPFRVTFHPDKLNDPLKWKNPCRVFVGSMGDMGHPNVPPIWRAEVARFMRANQKHTYMVLTKRPGEWMRVFAPYAWLGVTAENQARAEERIPTLLSIPAGKHFVSVEPMLGGIALSALKIVPPNRPIEETIFVDALRGRVFDSMGLERSCSKLDWVICGGETGPGARPLHPDDPRNMRDDCQLTQTPFFFKSWGEWSVDGIGRGEVRNVQGPDATYRTMYRVGKARAGAMLEGREWREWPG
ncbi:MAG: phage Gp37/Gp68 family protein [Patescibacteria group bacterium]